jgi:hypothetical protein
MRILINITFILMAVSVSAQIHNKDKITDVRIALPFTGEVTISNQKKNLINELKPIVVMEIVNNAEEIHFFICQENKPESSSGIVANINSESKKMAELAL